MFENIKRKLAHYLLSKKFLKNGSNPILFNKIITNSKSFFVILPEEESDLSHSLDLIKFLLIHKKDVTVFLQEYRYNFFPMKDKIHFITYSQQDISRLNLPSKNLLNKLFNTKYDIVIDLNRVENTFFSAVANIVSSKVRISFKKENSESYYNLLYFDNNNESELVFRNFLNFVRMF
ncbi:DUF6913 domain-containing protein [Rosettibacter firmus]|uniref:DUF6913 domain-containing protein n=1 Tax=Rosettibacter firmus TaxID=3111522 RepID=UPI00336C0863